MDTDKLVSESDVFANVRSKQVCDEEERAKVKSTRKQLCSQLRHMTEFFGKLTVEPVLFAYLIGVSMFSSTNVTLFVSTVCSVQMNYTKDVCDVMLTDPIYQEQKEAVQKVANNWVLITSVLVTGPCVFLSLIIGPWSDKYGRRLPLFVPIAGSVIMMLSYVILLLLTRSNPPPYAIVLAAFPSALTGNFMPIMIVMSYIADITKHADRTFKFVFVEGFVLTGLPVGGLISGYVQTKYGFVPVYASAAITQALGLIYGMLFVKETRGIDNTDDFKTKIAYLFKLDTFKESFKTCFKERPGNTRMLIIALSVAISFFVFFIGAQKNMYIYTQLIFDWNQWQFSVYQSSTNFTMLFVTMVISISNYFLNITDTTLGIISSLSGISSMIVLSIASHIFIFYIGGFLGIFIGVCPPVIRSCLSKLVSQDEIGGIFAITLSLESTMPILSALCYTWLYNFTMDVFPSCIYFLAGSFLLWPLIVFTYLKLLEDKERNKRRRELQDS